MGLLYTAGAKLTITILAIIAAFACGFNAGWTEQGLRQDKILKEQEIASSKLLLEATNDAKNTEAQLANATREIEAQHTSSERAINRLRADNARLVAAVRVRYSSANGGSVDAMPKAPGRAFLDTGPSLGDEFPGRLAEFSAEQSAAADRNTDKLIACQAYLKKLQEVMK